MTATLRFSQKSDTKCPSVRHDNPAAPMAVGDEMAVASDETVVAGSKVVSIEDDASIVT